MMEMKMRIVIVALFCFLTGAAAATEFSDVQTAQSLIREINGLRATRDLQASDIASISVLAVTTTGGRYSFSLRQVDTANWNAMLSALNTAVTNKIAALKTQLATLGVTSVPN